MRLQLGEVVSEILVGMCSFLPKTLILFMTKICDSPNTLFIATPKIWYPIHDLCGWLSCPEHTFWRSFHGLIDSDAKVVSYKRLTHTLFKTEMAKIDVLNRWKTIPFGAAHSYVAHIRDYPHPLGLKSVIYIPKWLIESIPNPPQKRVPTGLNYLSECQVDK